MSSYSDTDFDLLTTVAQGGCSAKIPAGELARLLADIHLPIDKNVLVDVATHDDAGVYKISDEMALIVTTDFFPPVCSSPRDFGRIAASNSLSDVYAMGGKPLLVLNLTMFPSQQIPMGVLREIMLGGQEKIDESGALTMGGHTIEDYPPKYGLAVVGTVHPDRVISNAAAREGDVLVLTKPVGTGVMVAAHRLGMDSPEGYAAAVEGMQLLNDLGAEVMQRHGVRAATDVTGFGLAGHLLSMACASGVTAIIDARAVPLLPGVEALIDEGCVPGGALRNKDHAVGRGAKFDPSLPLALQLAVCDPQTSGGLLMCLRPERVDEALAELRVKYPLSALVGRIVAQGENPLIVE